MHLGVRETREFQFEIELTTAKVSLVMSLVTFPTQFLSEKFFTAHTGELPNLKKGVLQPQKK